MFPIIIIIIIIILVSDDTCILYYFDVLTFRGIYFCNMPINVQLIHFNIVGGGPLGNLNYRMQFCDIYMNLYYAFDYIMTFIMHVALSIFVRLV